MLNLITDRSTSDIETAKAEIEAVKNGSTPSQAYMDGLRGCYNYADLNRVESAVKTLNDLLYSLGYGTILVTKSDWKSGDIFADTDLTRYLANVQSLRSSFNMFSTTPITPDSYNPYTKANDIEKILLDLELLIGNMQKAWFYSGEIYSDEF